MKVTLLSGFLGAGKTTLLKRILRTNDDREEGERLRMAVIVNDMGEINLDAEEIKGTKLVREDAEMVEMHNGCICCTLRGDLLRTVRSLAEEGRFDYLVVESTGIGEPLPVAQTFAMDVDDAGMTLSAAPVPRAVPDPSAVGDVLRVATDTGRRSLRHYAALDTLVTVVDALNVYDVLGSVETLADANNVSGMVGNTGAREAGEKGDESRPAREADSDGKDPPPPYWSILLAIALPFSAVLTALSVKLHSDEACVGVLGAAPLCKLSLLGIAVGVAVAALSLATSIFHGMHSECLFSPWAVRNEKALATLEAAMFSWTMFDAKKAIDNMMNMDRGILEQLLQKRRLSTDGTKEELCVRLNDAFAKELAKNRGEEEEDDRPISQLWLDQIEFANVLIVSKAAKLGDDKIGEIQALLAKLNPRAEIVVPREDKFGDLDTFATILNTGLFNLEESQKSAAWQQELAKEHNPETEEYGISSMTYVEDGAPFHPVRLSNIMRGFGDYRSVIEERPAQFEDTDPKDAFRGVIRTKGKAWIANANAFPMEFQTAGAHIDINPSRQPFLHEVVRRLEKEPDNRMFSWEFRKTMEARRKTMEERGRWTERHGDRRSELIFIGTGLDKEGMRRALDGALITEEETREMGGWRGWKDLEDPFWDGALPKHHFSWRQ